MSNAEFADIAFAGVHDYPTFLEEQNKLEAELHQAELEEREQWENQLSSDPFYRMWSDNLSNEAIEEMEEQDQWHKGD